MIKKWKKVSANTNNYDIDVCYIDKEFYKYV